MTTPLATPAPTDATAAQLAAFHARWHAVGGSERANYQLFITELCALLGVPLPDPARDDTRDNAYVFERRVTFAHGDGSQSNGFIDCYRRSAFVLEAKGIRNGAALAARGSKRLNLTMQEARAQAESYARALPASEGRPPLLLVVDVGHLIELFADFTRSGATYTPFPDVRSHRIPLGALCEASPTGTALRARLQAAWLDPMRLDPSRVSARVTREVSSLLAELARSLEAAGHAPHSVAAFLSRCLFCMFAEDVELLPRGADGQGAFIGLLRSHAAQPARLVPMLRALWQQMDGGGFSERLGETLLRFNGKLFKGGAADDYVLTLTRDQIELLQRAAAADWREVEPAIFGTLLERALDPTERHALGAHYTPRAYVERLVLPTVIEPLRTDWADAQAAALLLAREAAPLEGKKREAKLDEARLEIRRFHHQLCTLRVLDPACGSGNFLYVTLEHLKRLEAEVLDYLGTLGDTQAKLGLEGETVTLQQLRGIELNPRAATLAELVLWIGWLQWHIRSFGNRSVAEPVVHDYGNIECRDAVLAWDRREPALDAAGQPITRWDGKTFKPHPVTGEPVPDDAAQTPQWRYVNPRRAEWPQADFIVGNPPFIGAGPMRAALGDGYVEALRGVWTDVPDSADFVMHWWQRAAEAVRAGQTRRMGLITTNSLKQTFNRRVVEAALSDSTAHLAFAIPDHPWVDSAQGAAVRIAMTVLAAGESNGKLVSVAAEQETGAGEINVTLREKSGRLQADLRIGANINSAVQLRANSGISNTGVKLHGAGFIVSDDQAKELGLGATPELEKYILKYRNGRDLTDRPRNALVIDLHGLSANTVRARFPSVYQWVFERVKPERDSNREPYRRDNWWLFGRKNSELRAGLAGLPMYIATVETSKHRHFQFLDASVRPDNKLIAIASSDALNLGVLSSQPHVEWALAAGSRLGVGNDPVYVKTRCFETFPFPADDTGLTPALAERIRVLAEQIDAHRKQRQAAHDTVTLTGLYNVLAKLRSGEALNAKDKTLHRDGLVSVLQSLHDELDAAVLQAYGWADLGAVPWADATAREAWTEALLERLVALNTRRAAEEATGLIRWLRPSFQDPTQRAGNALPAAQQTSIDLPAQPDPDATPAETDAATSPTAAAAAAKKPWPSDNKEQLRSVAALLAASPVALSTDQIASHYTARGPWKKRLPDVLATLEAVARARCDGGLWRGV
jgi:hypothetical protein